MSTVRRIGPEKSVARDVNKRWSITNARELAVHFLWSVERHTEKASDYLDDPRVGAIVDALGRLDIHQVDRVLGAGSFGVAAGTLRGQVLKLTADPAEVRVGATLIGKNLPHVVAIYGAWFIRDVELRFAVRLDANGSPIMERFRPGILLEQMVDADLQRGLKKELTNFVMGWKDVTENHPRFYAHLSEQAKRERLRTASVNLEGDLIEESEMLETQGVYDAARLFRDVSYALDELRDVGVYAIDVHGGNVGLDQETKAYRIFDVGVGSPPPNAPGPGFIDSPDKDEPVTRREGLHLAEAVAERSVVVGEL